MLFSLAKLRWGGQFNVGGYDESYHLGPLQQIPLNLGGFYGVGLSQMQVNGVSITNFGSSMIDSGTTYTYMKSANYKKLVEGITKACGGGKCGGSPQGRTCWKLSGSPHKFPPISVFFGSVETKWVPEAYFYRKGSTDTYCYGFADDGPHANTEPEKNSTFLGHKDGVDLGLGLLKEHPFQFVGAVAGGVLLACLCLFLFKKLCLRRDKHRHVQLKEEDESGMPPQIVGAADAGFDAFVIGDDEAEHLEDGFTYADREDDDWAAGLGLQRRDKDTRENGLAPMDLLDTGNSIDRRDRALD
eukprot:g15877.t1